MAREGVQRGVVGTGGSNGVVVVHTVDGKLFGLESTNGNERWLYEREVPVLTLRGSGSPVLVRWGGLRRDGGRKADRPAGRQRQPVVGCERDGSERTFRAGALADIDGDPIVMRGGVFVATYQGEVAAIEQRSGRIAWQRKMSSYNRMGADREGLYISDTDGVVWGLDLRSGSARWSQDALKNRKLSNVAVLQDLVVVGDFEGYLHWLDRDDGRLVARTRVGSDPITTGLQVVDGVLYVLGDGGELAAVKLPAQR